MDTLSTSGVVLPQKSQSPRYHAFDCVRALAMLLGVFYHWQYVSGGGMGMGNSPKGSVDHWLHSFRMALFFLISGFFASMMLQKYGVFKYLARRSWRVGMPLLVSIFLFAGYRYLQNFPAFAPSNGMGAMGGFAMPNASPGMGGFAGFGMPVAPTTPSPATNTPPANMGGFGMGGFGAPGFGAPTTGGFPMAGFGAPMGQTPAPTAPPQANANIPALDPFSMGGPEHPIADKILNKFNLGIQRSDTNESVKFKSSDFQLQHLWFLWYLLIFCAAAPILAIPLGKLLKPLLPRTDKLGQWLLRWNLFPLLLALVSLKALMAAGGTNFDNTANWSLTNPQGFSGVFPDFIIQIFQFKDLTFYFIYFLFGWWFFRLRDSLFSVAKPWIFNLFIGIVAFAASQALYDKYHPITPAGAFGFGFAMPQTSAVKIPAHAEMIAFLLYALGSAYSGFGLLGFFQKYLDRPTVIGKYFTDTMLWVYLTQLAIIPYVGNWVDYNNTSWWEATLGGVVLVTAISLVLFEVFVRHTPLVHIFGPASLGKKKNPPLSASPSTPSAASPPSPPHTPATTPA